MEKSLGNEETLANSQSPQPNNLDESSLGDSQTLIGSTLVAPGECDDGFELTDLSARYSILRPLGQGGMGGVFLATDNRLKRPVAVNRIRGEQARSRAAVRRFLTEAQAVAALNHPNIVQVYDYGRDHEARALGATRRFSQIPNYRNNGFGFRVAVELDSRVSKLIQAARLDDPLRPKNNSESPSRLNIRNSVGIEFKYLPSGKFTTGDLESDHDKTQREVSIGRGFYIGLFEVTQEQYKQVTGTNPSQFKNNKHPVENVSWFDAEQFCRKLSELPNEKALNHVYRLPTEAEWEYACRAGTSTAFGFGKDSSDLAEFGWYLQNSASRSHPVGQKKPNSWGLYDTHGNVWEWCSDSYAIDQKPKGKDPQDLPAGDTKIYRGGSWSDHPRHCQAGFRNAHDPNGRSAINGFRIVLDLSEPTDLTPK